MINVLGMLYFSCLLLAIGNHLNNITIPLRMNQSGFDETWIGITMSANALGLILGCLIGRKLVERIGYVRTFVMSCAIFSGVVLSYSLWMNGLFWMGLGTEGGVSLQPHIWWLKAESTKIRLPATAGEYLGPTSSSITVALLWAS